MKILIFIAILLCHRATSAPQGILFGNENVQKLIFSSDNLPQKEVLEITEEEQQKPDKIEEVFISTEDIYNQALQICATNGSTSFDVPYYNRKQKGYVCHTLLSKGPCVHHENWWLVLDKETTRAKCVPKKCVKEDIHYDFIPFGDDICVDPKDFDSVKEICGGNKELGLNPFGEGECVCPEGFLEVYDKDNNLSCQLEYCQGICEEGFHHEIVEESGNIQSVKCVPNSENDKKCKEVGIRQLISGGDLDTVCPDGQHRDETDGRCRKTWARSSSKIINIRQASLLGRSQNILAFLRWRKDRF